MLHVRQVPKNASRAGRDLSGATFEAKQMACMQALRRHGSNGLIVLGAVLESQCRGPPIQLQQIITAADRLGE